MTVLRIICFSTLCLSAFVFSSCSESPAQGNIDFSGSVYKEFPGSVQVFVDKNGNGRLDAAEPATYANDSGVFEFRNLDFDPGQHYLIARVVPKQAVSMGRVEAGSIKSISMIAPPGLSHISPISTILAQKTIENESLEKAMRSFYADLDLSSVDELSRFLSDESAINSENNISMRNISSAISAIVPVRAETEDLEDFYRTLEDRYSNTIIKISNEVKNAKLASSAFELARLSLQDRALRLECDASSPVKFSIDVDGADEVVFKDLQLGASFDFDSGSVFRGTVSGRGNSTWEMPKKPFRIRIDNDSLYKSAESIFEMPKNRHWVLLANYADKTLMRNSLAFCMSTLMGLDWTPRNRFVELFKNGSYRGLYQLAEHVRVDTSRVNLGSGGEGIAFFLEREARYLDEPYWFVSGAGEPYVFKHNDGPSQSDSRARSAAVDFVNRFEQTLYHGSFEDLSALVDINSVVDLYIINELARNNDYQLSSSFLFKRHDDGKMKFGPVWDFDIAFGNIDFNGNERPVGFWVADSKYFVEFFKFEPFRVAVRNRWREVSNHFQYIDGWIVDGAARLDEHQRKNFAHWDILGAYVWPNSDIRYTYEGEVAFLRSWLAQRKDWLDSQWLESSSGSRQ